MPQGNMPMSKGIYSRSFCRKAFCARRGHASCARLWPTTRPGLPPTNAAPVPVPFTAVACARPTAQPLVTRSRPRTSAAAAAAASAPCKEIATTSRQVAGATLRITSLLQPDGSTSVTFDASAVPDNQNLVLHWAVSPSPNKPHDWQAPPPELHPASTTPFADGKAVRSPFHGGTLTISAPEDAVAGEGAPATLIGIVVRCSGEEEWLHADDGEGDLEAPLRPPAPPPPPGVGSLRLARRVAQEEASGGFNLFRRYCLVNETISEAMEDPSAHSAAVLLAWLRLSSSRQLSWYDGGNYQGKDMCHVQKVLAVRMAEHACGEGLKAHVARACLAVLPRGGGEGDAIRMTILDLLRNNGIKEGHRPGIECAFLQQWHQKLHSNTTRDDIAIAEAYLHFLHGSGDWGDFWWWLWEHHKLTPDDLANMKAGWRTQGITGPGAHLPFLVPAVQHLLWVLKVTHSGADLDTCLTMARGALDGELQWELDDMLAHRDEWWVPGKIVHLRGRLSPVWRGVEQEDMRRSVLLLDVALEAFWRTKMEALLAGLDGMSGDDAFGLLELTLDSHCISAGCTPEAASASALLRKLLHAPPQHLERWGADWAAHAVAVLDNCALAVSHVLDGLCGLVQAPADIFAAEVATVDQKYVANFGEEVVRGHPLFVASALIQKLRSDCRNAAGLGPWEVVGSGSGSPAVGSVVECSLASMQGQGRPADCPSGGLIVLSKELGGLEDVPAGVVAVLTAAPVDLLSHIAIRARNAGVLLASCADTRTWERVVAEHSGESAAVSAGPGSGDITIEAVNPVLGAISNASAPTQLGAGAAVRVERDGALGAARGQPPARGGGRVERAQPVAEWALPTSAFREGVVGGKSLGLRQLGSAAAADGEFTVPPAFALPYGAFERSLRASPAAVQDRFSAACDALRAAAPAGAAQLDMERVREALAEVRAAVGGVALPAGLRDDIVRVVAEAGASGQVLQGWREISDAPPGADGPEPAAWDAIKAVWASKWTERAFLSRRAEGIPEDDLCMAVLCMGLVPADYAFVLHTQGPVAGTSADDVYGEVVVGLGETLVGNSPGRAFAFRASKSDPADMSLLALPSKLEAHFAPAAGCLIARSDSNGEDLEGFAGAGLYESHTTMRTEVRCAEYADERLLWDDGFQSGMVQKLVRVAKAVEESAGRAQDIEGCFSGGQAFLLQSRAQV